MMDAINNYQMEIDDARLDTLWGMAKTMRHNHERGLGTKAGKMVLEHETILSKYELYCYVRTIREQREQIGQLEMERDELRATIDDMEYGE